MPTYQRSDDGLGPNTVHGWVGQQTTSSTSPAARSTSRRNELEVQAWATLNSSLCRPAGSGTHFGRLEYGLARQSLFSPSRTETTQLDHVTPRTGVLIRAYISRPVRCARPARRSLYRSRKESGASVSGCSE